jgi:carbonic anhydrase
VYSLTDFEFHMASEHTIDGNTYDLEMHLNHERNSDYADRQTLIDSVIEELGIDFELL